ncbi:MAG: TonB-dependent receptor [Gemmatimonadaceae bacterium]|nr:TonB-dependent receptor [Gemmatimonadaceae bacterium]
MRPWIRWGLAGFTLIAPALVAAQASGRVSGRVVDGATGRPLAGAEVLELGTTRATRADSAGAWTMEISNDGAARLRVRHPGHAYRDLTLAAGDSIQVALAPVARSLDAIIVTASRREQRLAESAVETALIDRTALRRSGAADLGAVLAEQSGLNVDGGIPAGAGVQMRGFDSRRVLILLDGQPLVGRVAGNFDLSRLPVSLVERVEVVKGPQSTLYGSDALGGVVNIITRRAEAVGWSAGLSSGAGTQGRLEGAGDLRWRRGDVGLSVDGGARTIDLVPGLTGENGTYARRVNGMTSLVWDVTSSTRLTGSMLGIGESQRYRTGQLYRFADNQQWAGRVMGERTMARGRLSATLHGASFTHLSRASTTGAPVSRDGEDDRQELWQGEVLWNAALEGVAVDAGVQARHERITADRVLDRRRDVSSAEPFAQATWSRGAFTLVPGARLTLSDQWGRFVAPRLAMMWRPRSEVAVRLSGGRGFRAPDFKELYLDFVNTAAGYAVTGNPDLRPERSASASLGAEWTGRRLWARATGWATTYRDFIETSEPDAAGTFVYRNLDRGSMQGIEFEAGVASGAWQLDGGVDVLRSRDRATGTPLLGRSRFVARSTLGGPVLGRLRGGASLVYTGRTPIEREASGAVVERGGWARVDARLTQPLPTGLTWSVGVTNLLDRSMGTAWPGFTGRQFVTGLEWRRE